MKEPKLDDFCRFLSMILSVFLMSYGFDLGWKAAVGIIGMIMTLTSVFGK